MRFKILEAFACGAPVVSTRLGVEGLVVRDGVHMILADSSTELAAGVVRTINDADLRNRCVENGFALVKERYSLDAAARSASNVLAFLSSEHERTPSGSSERGSAY